MKETLTLSQETLNTLLNLNYSTGILYWNNHPNPRIKKGLEAGHIQPNGYKRVMIQGVSYQVHRVVWAIAKGYWPKEELDHINGIRADNRPENLREARRKENARNTKLKCTNTSGFKGVHKHQNKWRARIQTDGKYKCLGFFDSPEEAGAAYYAAAEKYHKEFRRDI